MRSNTLLQRIAPLLALLLLAGCSAVQESEAPHGSAPPPADCRTDVLRQNVILVVGTHANMPRPVLTEAGGTPTSPDLTCALGHVLREGGDLTVIGVDGAPARVEKTYSPIWDEVSRSNHPALERLMRDRWTELDEFLTLSARTEGADLHLALEKALGTAARDPEGSVVIVLDNGLSDRGAVDLTRPSWSTAEPQDIVDAVAQSGQALQQSPGTSVILSGIASTAAPQPELSIVQQRVVRQVWETLVRDTGAEMRVDPAPWSLGEANQTDLETGIVEPVEPVVDSPTSEGPTGPIELDPSSLRFKPDEADPQLTDGARGYLEDFVRFQRDNGEKRLYVIGRTDSTPTTRWSSNEELSQARADAVREVLIGLGADGERIVSVGQGYAACPEDGGLDRIEPGLRAQNRVVIVGELDPSEPVPTGCFLNEQD